MGEEGQGDLKRNFPIWVNSRFKWKGTNGTGNIVDYLFLYIEFLKTEIPKKYIKYNNIFFIR